MRASSCYSNPLTRRVVFSPLCGPSPQRQAAMAGATVEALKLGKKFCDLYGTHASSSGAHSGGEGPRGPTPVTGKETARGKVGLEPRSPLGLGLARTVSRPSISFLPPLTAAGRRVIIIIIA
jgi:hypothetical protein